MRRTRFRNNLILGTSVIAASLFAGAYGRKAVANCVPLGGGTYRCAGVSAGQLILANDATVINPATNPLTITEPNFDGLGIFGSGAMSFTGGNSNTSITSYGDDGLDIRSYGDTGNDGSVTVNANGTFYGNQYGINAINYGSGGTSITVTGDVTGANQDGIFAANAYGEFGYVVNANEGQGPAAFVGSGPADGTYINVTTGPGTVTGGNNGIHVVNNGTGGVSVSSSGDVYGFGGDGINAFNSSYDTTASMFIYRAPGTYTYGAVNGINANNNAGSLTITALGTAVGGTGNGINAINNYNAGNIGNLTITANNAYGANDGIDARNYSASVLSVTTTGTVTGTGRYGIFATQNNANAGDLNVTVNAGSVVTGSVDGVDTNNYSGTGATNIVVNGTVSGTSAFGIDADDGATAGPMTITTGGNSAVTGGIGGISATHTGTGALTVNAVGAVTGNTGNGIFAYNGTNGTSLSVTTGPGTVSGGAFGIFADNNGTGGLTITGTGNVYGFGGDGIYANNSANDTTSSMYIYRAPGSYTYGAVNGINGINNAGSLTITALGTAVGGANNGINAVNNYNAINPGDLTITANNASGAQTGVNADQNSIGALSVTTTGAITGTAANGIQANNSANGTNLSVTVNSTSVVSGATHGIDADNNGTGTSNIVISGTVNAGTGEGVDFDDAAVSGAVSITVNSTGVVTSADEDGIEADADGIGDLTVTVNGSVTGDDEGLDLDKDGTGNLIVTTGVGSYVRGVNNEGIETDISTAGGTTTVTVNGAVVGNSEGIETDDAAVSGAMAITVSTTGSVTSADDDGVEADADGIGDLTVTVNGSVNGNDDGLDLDKDGTGNISVYTGVGSYIRGVQFEGVETDVSTAGGTTTIQVNGTVVAGEEGIEADNATASGFMTIGTGASSSVTGGNSGIDADHDGTGALTITALGSVTGQTVDGISANNSTTGTSLSVTAGANPVTGYNYGIYAINYGSGGISIAVTGDVTGTNQDGIFAANVYSGGYGEGVLFNADIDGPAAFIGDGPANGTYINVTTGPGTITGGDDGIQVVNNGTGGVSIQSSGDVFGYGGDGINAYNSAYDTTASMYIYRAPGSYTYGAVNGINANNNAGSLTITALGTAVGNTNNGINAINNYNAVNQGGTTILSNTAYGGFSGINALNYGLGPLNITTTGNTYGTNGYGVFAYNQSANPLTINVGYFSSVRGGLAGISAYNYGGGITINSSGYISDLSNTDSGLAITAGGGATTVNNYAGGFVRGRMNLSAFSDTVNNSGLWVTEGTSNFGAGIDTVNNSGLTVTGNLGGFREVTTLSNLETFNNTGTFDMSDDIAGNGFGNGDNTNDQTFMPSANWNGGGGSTLEVDAFLGAPGAQSDELHVNTTSGVTTINVVDNNAGPGSFNPTGILVVDANASSAGDFTLGTLTSVNGVAKVLDGRTVFDKGLFFYDLLFDEPNDDHLLVSLPDQEAFELTQLPAAASNIWHSTTGVWLDRTADIRSLVRHGTTVAGFGITPTADFAEPVSPAQKAGFGVWGKGVGAWTDRDASDGFTLFNQAFNFDTSYDQDTYGFLAGIDGGISTGDGGTLVFGALGGYVKSDLEFDASPTETEFEGLMVGGYVTYLNGGWFVDAMVKADLLDMDHDAPTLAPLASSADADADSIGVRVDGGYRFDVSPGFFLEPQATFAWVHTDIDSFTLAGAAISHDDADSIRISGGLRAGTVVSDADGMRIEASVMGRVWAELGDDNDLTIATAGPPLTLSDDFGQAYDIYGDVSGILNVINTDGPNVFVKGGVQFNDDFVTGNVQGGVGFEF